jgi:hypothetical protein
MKSRGFIMLILLMMLALPSAGPARASGGWESGGSGKPHEDPGEWTLPECSRITGTGAFTFTTDEGVTLARTSRLSGIVYSYGLAVLDEPNTLLAASMPSNLTEVLRSEDAGCSWSRIAQLDVDGLLRLVAGPGGIAYGYSRGRSAVYRIEGNQVTTLTAPANVYGLAVSPQDPLAIRIGGTGCQFYESYDGGFGFVPVGVPGDPVNGLFFQVAFHPDDWNQALCGGVGAWRTADGGQTWSGIEPFDNDDLNFVYSFAHSQEDPQLVWARANLDLMGEYYRDILVSHDGGATFQSVVRQLETALDQNGISRTLILTNDPPMAAHPSDDAVYFVYGSNIYDYGTDLWKYDYSSGALSVVHIDGLDQIDVMAFHPVDPSVMYLGLEEEGSS